ncbi:MAG: PqqD family protein [Bacteroidales bacterium]|nr:PqqD family protein [Bacteroidales bacterium]
MKARTGFVLRTLGREYILTAEGGKSIDFNNMIVLNSSAAFLWRAVEGKDFSVEDLASLLVEEYGIDRELALKDSATAASIWIEAGLVEE